MSTNQVKSSRVGLRVEIQGSSSTRVKMTQAFFALAEPKLGQKIEAWFELSAWFFFFFIRDFFKLFKIFAIYINCRLNKIYNPPCFGLET